MKGFLNSSFGFKPWCLVISFMILGISTLHAQGSGCTDDNIPPIVRIEDAPNQKVNMIVLEIKNLQNEIPQIKIQKVIGDPKKVSKEDSEKAQLLGNALKFVKLGSDWQLKLTKTVDLDKLKFKDFEAVFTCGSYKFTRTVYFLYRNTYPPSFSQTSYSVGVNENTPNNTVVFSLKNKIKDDDYWSSMTTSIYHYSLSPKGPFIIDPNNGDVVLNGPIDYESNMKAYSYTLSVKDLGDGSIRAAGVTVKTTLEINVLNEDDVGPKFTAKCFHIDILENVTNGDIYNIEPKPKAVTDPSFKTVINYKLIEKPTDFDTYFQFFDKNLTVKVKSDNFPDLKFNLKIKAYRADRPSMFDIGYLTINVFGVNKNPPEMVESSYSITIREDIHLPTLLLQVNAIDKDGNALEYRMTPSVKGISLDKMSGLIRLKDKDPKIQQINFQVWAIESNTARKLRSASSDVTIKIIDENNHSPVFSRSEYNFPMNQTASNNYEIGTVNATDEDLGLNREITYDLKGNPSEIIIDSNMGILRKKSNQPTKSGKYRFMVIATDKAVNNPRSASAIVEVTVQKENLNPPIFPPDMNTTITILESMPVGTHILDVYAKDDDSDHLSYTIEPNNIFGIQSSTNSGCSFLYLKEELDTEKTQSYDLVIIASDTKHDARHSLKVIVDGVNDNIPKFKSSLYTFDVKENVRIGHSVGKVEAFDIDINPSQMIYYSLADNGNFKIDAKTGKITTLRKFDVLEQKELSFSAFAIEDGYPHNLTGSCLVKISIIDINNHIPEFSVQLVQLMVLEDKMNDRIYHLNAIDKDVNPRYNEISYEIYSTSSPFTLKNKNDLYLKNGQESKVLGQTISVIVQAFDTDRTIERNSIKITITFKDINNKVPDITQKLYKKSIPEDEAIGSKIFTITAKDDDVAEENKKTEYSIVDWTSKNPFFLMPDTGDILLWKTLDADGTQDKTFSFKVRAQNTKKMNQLGNGKTFSEAQVEIKVINVNDNPPKFAQDVYLRQVKETETKRQTLFQISANDIDNDAISYSLKGDHKPFIIVPSTGEFSLSGGLSHEKKSMYNFTILATENGKQKKIASARIVILVESVNKAPIVNDGMTFSILEEQRIGTNVGCIQASDPDGDTLVYSTKSKEFSVNSITGELKSQIVFDYESKNQYQVFIQVADNDHQVKKSVTINVIDANDHDPSFSKPEYNTTLQDFSKGFVVIKLVAKDDDKNDKLRYSLIGDSDFVIKENGEIQLAKDLDWKTKENSIALMASVNDEKNSSTSVLVSILLVKPLEFVKDEFTASIPEDSPIGTTVFQFEPCNFVDRTVTIHNLEVVLPNTNSFYYNKTSGCILTKAKLDREIQETHRITMELKGQNVIDLAKLNITIEDVNDEHPILDRVNEVIELSDDTEPGFFIIKMNATDKDKDEGFTFLLEETYGKFVIDAHSGVIRTRSRFNYRLKPKYILTVVVIDHGSPPLESNQTVTLRICDGNRHTPTLDQQLFNFTVDESTQTGYAVGQLTATDTDQGANGQLSFCIISGNIDGAFAISNGTVQVNNSRALDYEKRKMFNLSVGVSDNGINPKSSTATVLVNLVDINDHSPVFKSAEYVSKHLPILKDEIIFTLDAVDADSKKNEYNKINYYQLNHKNIFDTDLSTGSVKSKSDLTDVKMFALKFEACDGGQKCTGETVMLSTYSDVPDIIPVDEGIKNALVIDINATDGDLGVDYTLISCNDYFMINSSTGIVRTKIPLVWRRQNDRIPVTVVVHNSENKSNYTEMHITVQVIDVNDHSPEFSQNGYQFQVEENSMKTFHIQATDEDDRENANITYSFYHSDPQVAEGSISLNPQTGLLNISSLNRENKNIYTFDIVAEDKGDPPKSSTVSVIIEVLDANDNAPIFTKKEYKESIKENSEPQKILTVHADDADGGLNRLIYYELQNKSVPFTINQITGEIWSMEGLDFEKNSMYKLQVLARDQGINQMTSSCYVSINVIDICDEVPELRTIIPLFKDRIVGTPVFSLASSENSMNYNISAENNILEINEKTGNVITHSEIPQKRTTDYHMTVTAWGHCNLPVYTKFEIKPEEPFPTSSGKKLKAEITENDCSNESIFNLSSMKGFEGKDVTFTLRTFTEYFKIENGQIYCLKKVDRETHSKFVLLVDVTFKNRRIAYTVDESLEIVVAVKDVNDNPPTFKSPSLFYSIPSTAQFFYRVGKIQVIDQDADENGASQFSISGLDKDVFYINPSTGELHTLFDATNKTEFKLIVKAVDQNGNGLSSTVPLKVSVYNNNFNLEMNIDKPVDFMEKILYTFIGNLSTIIGLEIVLDQVQVHQDPNGKLDLKRSDILFHALDLKKQKLVSKQTVQSKMDAKKAEIENLLRQLGMKIIKIKDVPSKPVKIPLKTSTSQAIIIVLACIIFIGCLMGIIMTVVLTRRQQKKVRELKAAAAANAKSPEVEVLGIYNYGLDNGNEYTSHELSVMSNDSLAANTQNGDIPNQRKAEDGIFLQDESSDANNHNESEAKDGYPSVSKANHACITSNPPSSSSSANDEDGLETEATKKGNPKLTAPPPPPPPPPTMDSSKDTGSASVSSGSLQDVPIIIPSSGNASKKQNGDLDISEVKIQMNADASNIHKNGEEPAKDYDHISFYNSDDDGSDLVTEL